MTVSACLKGALRWKDFTDLELFAKMEDGIQSPT